MRILTFSFVFILLSISDSEVLAQLMKYKHIYPMLVQKDYEQALPYLEKFLELIPRHPNAVLHMGILAQDYQNDCEKALDFYDTALNLIDNKEVKKNEKYYSEWNRRNLRTGKYGVNLDDLHKDLEKRIKQCSQ